LASLQLVGFGTGPLICSFFVRPGNVEGAFQCAAGLVLVSLTLYIIAIVGSGGLSARRRDSAV
jgi:hypothetical protein